MKTKHSLAPWRIENRWIKTADGKLLTDCFSVDCTDEETEANLHLITAAPEMLEEIESILDDIEYGRTLDHHKSTLEKLVAKAKAEV